MDQFKEKYGPWALITGASAGMGSEFARQLAGNGLNLILVARRKERLEALAEELTAEFKILVKVIPADLGQADFIEQILAETDSLDVGLLVNNAGYATTGEFLAQDIENEVGLLDVNCRAPLVLTHAFGRRMAQRGRGGIIFLSSIAAFIPMPRWSNYSSSKLFNLHFATGLHYELKEKGIDVLALCPGKTKSEFAQVAGIEDDTGAEASEVVALALKKLGRKVFTIPGFVDRLNAFGSRMLSQHMNAQIGAAAVKKLLNPVTS